MNSVVMEMWHKESQAAFLGGDYVVGKTGGYYVKNLLEQESIH